MAHQDRPRLIVYLRKTVGDMEDHTYSIRGIAEDDDEYDQIIGELKNIEGLQEVRGECDEIVAGVESDKEGSILKEEEDDDGPSLRTYSAGYLTAKVRETVERFVGHRIRVYFREEKKILGELIFGDDWHDAPGAFTEEERDALGY